VPVSLKAILRRRTGLKRLRGLCVPPKREPASGPKAEFLLTWDSNETTNRLLVTANVVPISLILVTLTMEALRSSETSATRLYIPEDAILHSDRRENPKSYITLIGWTM
jgi:hypothetical protein